MDEAELIKMIPHVVRSSTKKVWIDYDEEADVLYISFVYPPNAIEHEEDEDGIIRNYLRDLEGEYGEAGDCGCGGQCAGWS